MFCETLAVGARDLLSHFSRGYTQMDIMSQPTDDAIKKEKPDPSRAELGDC
jgi:hypothetical protein